MFNRHFWSILNGLYVIRLFWFGWDFPMGGAKFMGFGGKMAPKHANWEKHLLAPNCVFWAIVREIFSTRLAQAGAQEKKTGRKKSHEKRADLNTMWQVCSSRWRNQTCKVSSLQLKWFRCSEVLKSPCCPREARPSLTLCFTAHVAYVMNLSWIHSNSA